MRAARLPNWLFNLQPGDRGLLKAGWPSVSLRPRRMFFPLPLIAGSLTASAAAMYYATYAVRSQWLGPTVWCGRADTNEVALTFDDGPTTDTEALLEVL